MQDGQSRALQRLRGTAAAKAEVRQDAKSRLQKLVAAVGNDEIGKRIAQGNATRDEMLAFVLRQLDTVRELQLREQALTRKEAGFPWWRDVQNGAVGKPEPTRWKAVAAAYDAAVAAICRGDLKRGQALLEQAVAQQRETTAALTALVDRTDLQADADPSELAALVAEAPSSGACAVPEDVRNRLDEIERVEATVKDQPDAPREQDPWWTLEDEEEEDGAGGGGGAGAAG